MKRKVRSNLQRSSKGQGIVAGVIAITLLALGTAAACTLLCSSGMSNTYKEKMSFVAGQCAKYLLSTSNSQNLDDQTKDLSQQFYSSMGLTINDQTATAKGNSQQMQVTLTGKVNVIPAPITLTDTETATPTPTNSNGPWTGCVQAVGVVNGYIPCVNTPANPSGPVVGFTHAGLYTQ
ncbi:MAG: hypothetical protein K2Y22_07110 [Candidatus Obscuribacterales bacterium]|nr:hypothetical protein [Candidatus Obscuribacterales bacterium]